MALHAAFILGRSGAAYELCVGMEVHTQLRCATKLLSGASAAGARLTAALSPNAAVSLFDAAHPGTMPAINVGAVVAGVKAAAALQARVTATSWFDRKHYFYGDLPLGYQVTQCDAPLASCGVHAFDVPLRTASGKPSREVARKFTRIARLQLEQDSGKSVHTLARDASVIDLNRAGVALLEIVTAPDLRSADEAAAFLRSLQGVLRHVGVSDCAMEEGAMRADVNVSVRRVTGGSGTAAAATSASASADGMAHAHARVRARDEALEGVGEGRGRYTTAPIYDVNTATSADASFDSLSASATAAAGRAWGWRYDDPDADPWGPNLAALLDADVTGGFPAAAAAATAAVANFSGSGSSGNINYHRDDDTTASPAASRALLLARWAAAYAADPTPPFGARVELKNVSSVRAVHAAITSEAARQVAAIESGGRVTQQTRVFDVLSGTSTLLRTKEEELDYRFMREPDLAPILISQSFINACVGAMPVPLSAIRRRYVLELGLSEHDARVIVGEPGAPAYYETALRSAEAALPSLFAAAMQHAAAAAAAATSSASGAPSIDAGGATVVSAAAAAPVATVKATSAPAATSESATLAMAISTTTATSTTSAASSSSPAAVSSESSLLPVTTANWLCSELFGRLTDAGRSVLTSPIDPERFGELVAAVASGTISGRAGKRVLGVMLEETEQARPTSTSVLLLEAEDGSGIVSAVSGSSGSGAAVTADGPRTPSPPRPLDIVAALNLWQNNDVDAIRSIAETVLSTPSAREMAAAYTGGRTRVLGALVALVMEASDGRANPAIASEQVILLAKAAASSRSS